MKNQMITLPADGRDLQTPFDIAVIVPTVLRPSLLRAVTSIFEQDFTGRVQILIGIDKPMQDVDGFEVPDDQVPPNMAVTILDLGYSTSSRHGGLAEAWDGGYLRTILSFMANSRVFVYLDDDNWWAPDHLRSLYAALEERSWAYALRWFVAPESKEVLAIDTWESIGLNKGVYAEKFGGWVDPNCLIVRREAIEPVLSRWSRPMLGRDARRAADRNIFDHLCRHYPYPGQTGLATVYYELNAADENYETRMSNMEFLRRNGSLVTQDSLGSDA